MNFGRRRHYENIIIFPVCCFVCYAPVRTAYKAERSVPNWIKEYEMKGDLYDFLFALGHRESGNKYEVKNSLGYMGRWQFGKPRLYDLGISIDGYAPKDRPVLKVITWDELKSDSLRQDMAVLKHVRLLKNYFNKNAERYKVGGRVLDIPITVSGLVAGAHLLGIGGVNEFIAGKDGGDAYATKISEYISKFGDYDLTE